jgi:hypothetical protein
LESCLRSSVRCACAEEARLLLRITQEIDAEFFP